MGALIASIALLGVAMTTTATSEPVISKDGNHFSQKVSRGKETIRVDVGRRPFHASEHQLKMVGGGVEKVDGHSPLGTDASPPQDFKTEVSELRVSWDGVTVALRRELFQNCFNANLASIKVAPSEDFGSVMIVLSGGDGAGAYDAYVVVSRNGFATRFLADEGGL
jgi:hypothetical protein